MPTKRIYFQSDENTAFDVFGAATRYEALESDDGDTSYMYADDSLSQQLNLIRFLEPADAINVFTLGNKARNTEGGGGGSRIRDRIRYNNSNIQNGNNRTPGASYPVSADETDFLINQETGNAFTAPEINHAGSTGIVSIIFATNNFVAGDEIRVSFSYMDIDYEYNEAPEVSITSHSDVLGPELMANADLSGTGGSITGSGSGTGDVADDWEINESAGANGIYLKGSDVSQIVYAVDEVSRLRSFTAEVEEGKRYVAEFSITNVGDGSTIQCEIKDSAAENSYLNTTIDSVGTYIVYFTALADASDLGFVFTVQDGESVSVLSASIKRVKRYNQATSGQNVNFTGTGTDTEDGALTGASLEWESDLDGVLGTGTSINVNDLTAGLHEISLTATDSGGKTDLSKVLMLITEGSKSITDIVTPIVSNIVTPI